MTLPAAVLPFIIAHLSWEDRYKLSQVNRQFRSIICGGEHELEAFLYIAEVYNCFVEVFDEVNYANPYFDPGNALPDTPASGYVKGVRTWLGVLVRTERLYRRRNHYYQPQLPVGSETWPILPDSALDRVVKKAKFMISSFVVGCQDPNGDRFLTQISRYTYPNGGNFNCQNFLRMKDEPDFEQLASTAISNSDSSPMQQAKGPFVEAAVRLVYVDRPGELTAFKRVIGPDFQERLSAQQLVTVAVLRDPEIINKYILSPTKYPYIFARWLAGVSVHPSLDPELAVKDPSVSYLARQQDLLDLDPAKLWDTSAAAMPMEGSPGEENQSSNSAAVGEENCSEEIPALHYTKDNFKEHWRHVLHEIETHLGQVFKPFTVEEADALVKCYSDHGMTLTHVGKCEDRKLAYLEVSLTSNELGPNRKIGVNDHRRHISLLYIGPVNAVLYIYNACNS